MYFEKPTQVKFRPIFEGTELDTYIGGIAYQDRIICGHCGMVLKIENVGDMIEFPDWINLDKEICGDE